MNIASLLAQVTGPDRPALIVSGGNESILTFRGLDNLSSRLAAGMMAEGLRTGDRVIVLAPISPMLYAALAAVFRLGATAVFLDPQTPFQRFNRAVRLAHAQAFIGAQKAAWLGVFLPALRHIPIKFTVDENGARSLPRMARAHSPLNEIADVAGDSPALITFTGGGTDGSPRGVLRTHQLLTAQHFALSRVLPAQAGDVDLTAFPVAVLHNLASGIPSVIPDLPFRKPDAVHPERILRQINRHKVTTASGSPAFWSLVAGYCLQHGMGLPLRRIVMGGAPASPNLMKQLSGAAPNAEILNLYGSTEAEPVAALPLREVSDETTRRIETGAGIPLGRGVPEICVRILNENREELPSSQIGEIWVSGNHVARGYFLNPQADAAHKHFDEAGRLWHRMGDFGYKDEKGRLWLVGRINTAIARNGMRLYPVPVEAMVETLPFVRRAALVGVPDDTLGERAVLALEFSEGAALPGDWRKAVRSLLLARGWAADEIRPVRKIPMDARHNARIDYLKLKSLLSQRWRSPALWKRGGAGAAG
jgi:acyl-CoA synthetase (AMP-forming)/AMP-acid ligase II